MRPADAYQGVDESLQADVMRFMAIIAFCLIAILALVRSVEPAPPVPARSPLPANERADAEVPPAPAEAERAVITAPMAAPTRPPLAQPEPAHRPEPEPLPEPAMPVERVPAQDRPVEQGLSLRFASDSDFLRLVSSGSIRVYAFREGEVLSVGRDFGFQPVQAPGALHELLPETVPDLMTAALQAAHGERRRPGVGDGSVAYQWGMVMPERMARQIRDFVDRGASGALVIDRHGEVRHRDG